MSEEKAAAAKWSPALLGDFARRNDFSGKKIFLFCGQLREKKRLDWLLSAFQAIRQRGYDYLLFVIGPDVSHGRRRNLGCDVPLCDGVRFLGPMYGVEQLAPWFLSARALVVPRAIGLAALHGFAFNLPCITSRDRRYQTPEVSALKDGHNCLLFDDGNLNDLSAKMISLGENDALVRALSANARRTMEDEYTVAKMVDGFVDAIRYAAMQRQ